MALGFGFNKQKVLASAEKYVQQGKLTNAIAEYEKILEKDPKDLTVLNTIGDLYARDGDSSKASEYYTRVGDSYAQQGFTRARDCDVQEGHEARPKFGRHGAEAG